jgi:hypothetical protein
LSSGEPLLSLKNIGRIEKRDGKADPGIGGARSAPLGKDRTHPDPAIVVVQQAPTFSLECGCEVVHSLEREAGTMRAWLWAALGVAACGGGEFTNFGFGDGGAAASSSTHTGSGGASSSSSSSAASSSSSGSSSSSSSSSSAAASSSSSSSGGKTDAQICAENHPAMKTCVAAYGDICVNGPGGCADLCVAQCGAAPGHGGCLNVKPDQGPCCCYF